jgi:diguanylate cyclase (GGDEF)-like protein
MRDFPISISPWTCLLLVILLGPLSVYVGGEEDLTLGAASLAFLLLPTCVAALSGSRKIVWVTATLAAASCLAELVVGRAAENELADLLFPIFAAGVLLACNLFIALSAEQLHRKLRELSAQVHDYLRQLYESDRRTAAGNSAAGERAEAAGEPVNHAMLLLTLQDVGRRISSNLDLDTLIPTIVNTASTLLKCGQCQIFLWDAENQILRNPLPDRNRRGNDYIPHPQLGMAGWVLAQRHILTRQDIHNDYTLRHILEEEPLPPDAAAPLSVGGELLGLLVLHDVEDESPNFTRLLYILSNMSALGIKNAQLFKRIEEMARRDGLTGLLNHATFQENLRKLADQSEQQGRPLTVVMSDVDHFKKFNDTHGHQAGDHVLREVARLWQAVMPDYAVLARYGGEEFICALPGDDTGRAFELAELLRRTLADFPMSFEGRQLQVTASFGVAELGRPARNIADVIRSADEALYKAKQGGRNQVCSQTGMVPLSVER